MTCFGLSQLVGKQVAHWCPAVQRSQQRLIAPGLHYHAVASVRAAQPIMETVTPLRPESNIPVQGVIRREETEEGVLPMLHLKVFHVPPKGKGMSKQCSPCTGKAELVSGEHTAVQPHGVRSRLACFVNDSCLAAAGRSHCRDDAMDGI